MRTHPGSSILLALCLPVASVFAGLPQPALFHFGTVQDSGNVITGGIIEFVYTPVEGGPAIRTRDFLRRIEGPSGEVFSYSIQIPVEEPTGFGNDSPTAISLSSRSRRFNRQVLVNGEAFSLGASILGQSPFLNVDEHAGFVERIDVLRVPAGGNSCCPGDANRSGSVSLDDFSAVRGNFGRRNSLLGDANCNDLVNILDFLSVRDHFGQACEAPAEGKSVLMTPLATAGDPSALLEIVPSPSVGPQVRFDIVLTPLSNADLSLLGVLIEYPAKSLEFVAGTTNRQEFNLADYTGEPRLVQKGLIGFSAGTSGSPTGSVRVASLEFRAISGGWADIGFAAQGERRSEARNAQLGTLFITTSGTRVLLNPLAQVPSDVWLSE